MAGAPEAAGAAGWIEGLGAGLLAILTIGTQAWRYIKESTKEDAKQPNHVVLEAAELADMRPFRAALVKLDRLLEMEADVEQTRRDTTRILEIIDRMDRAEEIERKAEELAARIVADRERRSDR